MPKKKAAAPAVTGYVRRPRYRDIEFSPPDLEEGEEPLKVKIQRNLTFDQIEAIPTGEHVTFPEAWEAIYPYVVEWNLLSQDQTTGEMAPVPPPAEAGPDVAKVLDAEESLWLIMRVKSAHLGGDERKNDSTPSGSTPEPGGEKS